MYQLKKMKFNFCPAHGLEFFGLATKESLSLLTHFESFGKSSHMIDKIDKPGPNGK